MNPVVSTSAPAANGASTLHDLFALTDEQILEIEPEGQDVAVARDPLPVTREEKPNGRAQASSEPAHGEPRNTSVGEKTSLDAQATAHDSSTGHGTRSTEHDAEPPAWLAAQMKDPWSGEEAKELWNGVQQARQEAAAYRAAFATPEDARALKELYPGGVSEARAAAERAKLLDQIDGAYFGAAGSSAEQTSASRTQLAAMMLREDPAAFREMVFAGLRALETAGQGANTKSVAQAFKPEGNSSAVGATLTSPATIGDKSSTGGAPNHGTRDTDHGPQGTARDTEIAAYAAFEKAANEDLERSVGLTIARTIEQALPNLSRTGDASAVGTQGVAPLQARLSATIRGEVEAALKGDRQLGEQIAQILSARRFDGETRAQVVRLIGERAQQLVPSAAKRVLNDWTQTTLAAHRTRSARGDTASARREVAHASLPAGLSRPTQTQQRRPEAGATRPDSRRVDYRKLSDEQILDM